MEANSEASCMSDPNFAVICAFLERFAKSCGITHPPFLDLQEMLENIDEVPQELIDLHIILLRKARRSVFREKWEKALVKFCQIYSTQDGWEIERFGYKNSRLEVKLRVLKNLLEGQFDLNCKFKSIINTHESNELRSKPVGKDKSGRIYWLQVDPISNIRVYREDLDEESWTLVAKDRDTLVQLLQELTVDEEPVDVNLLNEDSSVSVDIEKTILDTGQENGIGDVVTNGDALAEEKDPLEIKTGETMINDVGYDDCYNDVLNDVGKRVAADLFPEGDFKKAKLEADEDDVEVGEAIDDPVMHIYGEGNGAECEAGNPDKEEHKTSEGNTSSNTSEQSEPCQTPSTDIKKLELETKPQPKLWSIDTICGTNFNHSGESSKSVKSAQKNFSSFSIESVLEKKSDSNHSSSPVPESPVISVNAITASDPALGSINQANKQIVSTGDVALERSESRSCNESVGGIPLPEEGRCDAEDAGKSASSENETDSVPTFEDRTNEEDSTACAENPVGEKQTDSVDQIHDDNLKVNTEETSVEQEVPDASTHCLESSEEGVLTEGESVHVPTESEAALEIEPGSLDSKQSSDVRETGSEFVEGVDAGEVGGESSVTEVKISEELTEETEETEDEVSKIEDPVEEVSPDKDEDKAGEGTPEKQEEKFEEPVAETRSTPVTDETAPEVGEAPVVEEPEKESEESDPRVPADERVETLQEMNDVGESSNQVLAAEEEEQSEKEAMIEEEGVSGREEVSGNLDERAEEERPCEASQEAGEDAEKTSEEAIPIEDMNVSEPGSMLTDQERTPTNIPEEKSEVEESVKEEFKTENESEVCDEVDDPHVPGCAPPVDESVQSPAPELAEAIKVEKDDTEATPGVLTADEEVQDGRVLEEQVRCEIPEKMDVDQASDVKREALDNACQDSVEPSTLSEELPLIEVTGKEAAKPEEAYSNDLPAEEEPKGTEENCGEPSQILSDELKHEKELPPSEEVKDEPAEEITDKPEDNEISKEEDETKAQPGKGRKRRRSRKQSGDVTPARATRSAKKSVDEDVNNFQELPLKKETRKRKSQDSDSADLGKVSESGQGEEASAAEGEDGKVETRRNSTVSAVSDENCAVAQEQVSEVGKKRKKMRKKKGVDSRVRKSTEEKQESSEDENKAAEEGEAPANEEEKKKRGPKTKAKDGTPRTRQLIPERELKLLGISNMEELPTVRQSRRIAQLKLKEEAERKKLEEAAKEEAKKEKKRKKKKKKLSKPSAKKRKTAAATGEESYEEGGGGDEDEDAEVKRKDKKRKKKKDKLVFNELNPWISSSGSSSADEEDEEIEDEAHEEEEILFKSDHEFSPESDVEDPDYKPIKRARTAKVDPKDATEADSKYDDTACEKCGEKDHPEWILLCDKCDKGWHASCVRPALMVVPEGDWFCPPCEHTSLVQKLRESLVEYDRCQKQRENEELRRKRLAFVGISLDNVLPSKKEKKPKPVVDNEGESEETASENGGEDSSSSGSSSSDASSSGESSEPVYQLRERRTNVTSYRYNEYDELIKSALQEEMEAAKGVGLGKGKDIGNQAEGYEEGVEGAVGEDGAEERNDSAGVSVGEEAKAINPQLPRDILEAKPRLKPKKERDEDYEVESDAEEDEDYNEEENGEAEEEDEELGDEVPPVVPRYDKKKKKTRSLNVKGLDFTSDEEEEDNSDSDFKGESSEEESEYSLPSESESSDGIRRKHKSFDGPLRRSTRARTARYDKEFINDDSEDEAPRKKKSRNVWIESESSDSDRSWGKRKKRNTRGGNRSTMPKKKAKAKAKKKKSRKKSGDSDYEDEEKSKKSRNRKVKYGGLDEVDEEQVLVRRTRGKKINYQEMNASDSEDEVLKRRPRVIGDSDEEFVAEKDKSGDSDAEDDVGVTKSEANGKAVSKKSILRKIKKKRPKVIPDPNDFSEEDLLEDEELDVFAEELENLDEEEEDMLQEMLNDGDVPIRELKEALGKLKERRKEKAGDAKPCPPIPEHLENPGLSPRFPRIGKMKAPPNRSELASQLALPPESALPGIRTNPGVLLGSLPKDGDRPENVRTDQQGNMMLLSEPKTDPKEGLMNLQPPPYPFPAEGPPGVPPLVNAHAFPLNNRPPAPPYNSFQGMIPPHARLPPEYPHPNIPTTVLGIENDSLQDIRKQGQKSASNNKRKNEDGLSPQADSGEENSGDVRIGDNVDSPKRRGRGRGKKQLLAEAQGKQEIAISTVQAPTQFPPRGAGPEGAATGSVITRMLNTPQGPQPFPPDFNRGRSFRPPFPNALRPPLNPPSPSPLRTSSSLAAPPSLPLFHVTLPLDIPPSSIGLPQGKPSQLPPGFPSRPPVLPRYPSDPSIRPPFPPHSSSRSENFPYPNFYPGPFPPPIPNNEEAPFHNPNFPSHPFDEHSIPGSVGAMKPPYEEEAGGEFGGLASYFASQREDDLDT